MKNKKKKQYRTKRRLAAIKEKKKIMRRAQTAMAADYLVSIGIPADLIEPLSGKTIRLIGACVRSELDLLQEQSASDHTITVAKTHVREALANALKEMSRDNKASRYELGTLLSSTHVLSSSGKTVIKALERTLHGDDE